MAEDDRLSLASVVALDLRAVLRRDRAHVMRSLLVATKWRRHQSSFRFHRIFHVAKRGVWCYAQ